MYVRERARVYDTALLSPRPLPPHLSVTSEFEDLALLCHMPIHKGAKAMLGSQQTAADSATIDGLRAGQLLALLVDCKTPKKHRDHAKHRDDAHPKHEALWLAMAYCGE